MNDELKNMTEYHLLELEQATAISVLALVTAEIEGAAVKARFSVSISLERYLRRFKGERLDRIKKDIENQVTKEFPGLKIRWYLDVVWKMDWLKSGTMERRSPRTKLWVSWGDKPKTILGSEFLYKCWELMPPRGVG